MCILCMINITYLFMWICSHIYAGVYACRGQMSTLHVYPYSLSTLFFDAETLTESKPHQVS